MNEPLISVIVPVYNVEKYLENCVNTLVKQTYRNIEILLINDGSTDASGSLCEELAQKDERIKVFHKPNGGLSDARNYGVEKANGDYIGFVDSDDYVHELMYEKLLDAIITSNADMSECTVTRVYKNTTIDFYNGNPFKMEVDAKKYLEEYLLNQRVYGSAWCKLIKADIARKVKFSVGKIYEDAYYSLDLIKILKKIVIISDSLYFYFIREGSITTKPFSHKDMDYIEIVDKLEKYVHNNFPEYIQLMEQRKCLAYLSILNQILEVKEYKKLPDYKYIKSYFRSNSRKIIFSKVHKKLKVALVLLNLNESLYRFVLKQTNNRIANE